jgi:hypothetical protein
VPFAQRASVLAVVFGVAATAVVGGCGADRRSEDAAGGFCAEITHGRAAFDFADKQHSKVALAAFDRVVASAPAVIAPDLKTVSHELTLLFNDPVAIADPVGFRRYVAAIDRVDKYLRQTCGVSIPKRRGT